MLIVEAHLFELGPHRYYQGKGGLANTWFHKFVVDLLEVDLTRIIENLCC